MNKRNRRNHYRILHVQADAPTEVIKASYRALMQKLRAHPDLGGDEWNASVINQAYRVLTDPTRRAEYDLHLRSHRREIDPAQRRACPTPGFRPFQAGSRRHAGSRKSCLFCGTENAVAIAGYSDQAQCRSCNSPLTRLASRRPGSNERRAVKRVALKDEISFYTDWPQPFPSKGRIVDLSPMGMQFFSDQKLQPNLIIKLEGRGLSAVARVVRDSQSADYRNGQHLVGVQFAAISVKARQKAS